MINIVRMLSVPVSLTFFLNLSCIKPLPVPGKVIGKIPENGAVLNTPEITFVWQAVDDGARYLLQVATDSKFRSLTLEDTVADTTVIRFFQTDGKYFWRVRVENSKGIWSEWSTTDSFILQRFLIVNSVKTQGYPHDIAISGAKAYIADGQAGLSVFDISNPETPIFLNSVMDSLNVAWGVAVEDTFAFVAYGYKELLIVNVARSESLKTVGVLEYPQPGYGYDVAVQDSWAFIAAGAQFIVVNVSDPRYPNLRFQSYYPRGCRSVVTAGQYLFVALEQLGIAAWRTDTFPPVQIGTFDTPGNARGVVFKDGILYIADGRNGIIIVDATNPTYNMVQIGALDLAGYASSLTIIDSLLYVVCGSSGVMVVNCSNPSKPYLMAQIKTPYVYAVGLIPDAKYFFAVDRDLGIITLKKEF